MKDNNTVWFNGGLETLTVSQKQIYQTVVKALPISRFFTAQLDWFTHIKSRPQGTF